MTIIALALFFAVVYWFVIAEAHDDYDQIRRQEKINHVRQWIFRAVIVGGVAFILWAFTPLSFLPLWGAGGFLFSALFRWKLNKLRGLDWRYLSPSSWYDFVFLAVSRDRKPKGWKWMNWRALCVTSHWINYEVDERYRNHIHRSGLLAYIVEAITSIACIVWAVV